MRTPSDPPASRPPRADCYDQEKTLNFLRLRADQLPLLGALIGNDYISAVRLVSLQWRLVKQFTPNAKVGEMEKVPPAELVRFLHF